MEPDIPFWRDWYDIAPDGTVKQIETKEQWNNYVHRDPNLPVSEGGKRIGGTEVSPEVWVSTVFLGLDHGWNSTSPVLFETMIFGGKHDDFTMRYCTYSAAKAGHETAVKLAKGEIDEWPE